MDYIQTDQAFTAVIIIPESSSGDTVTYAIYKASDGSTFASGSMTFVAGYAWKVSFTPDEDDTYILAVDDTTIDSQREEIFISQGEISTIVASPSGIDLTTLASVKANYDIDTNLTDHDTLIQDLITQKSKEISVYCGRTFATTTHTEQYDGRGESVLIVNNYPIQSITSIYDDVDRSFSASTLIDSSNYVCTNEDANGGMIRGDGIIFSKGVKNIKVIYSAGYDTIPQDLVYACEKLVMADYVENLSSKNTAESDEVIYRPSKMRREAWKIIALYKRYV